MSSLALKFRSAVVGAVAAPMARYSLTRARYREARALEMAATGMDWPTISAELGYADRTGAYKAARRALDRKAVAAADTYRDEILHRTDVVIDRSWSTALEGDLRATEAVLRAMATRERIMGLTKCDRKHVPAGTAARRAVRVQKSPRASSEVDDNLGVFTDFGAGREPDRPFAGL